MVDLGGIQNKLEKNKNAKKIHTHTHTHSSQNLLPMYPQNRETHTCTGANGDPDKQC